MTMETVPYFSAKDDEIARLLVQIGTNRNMARVLVFLTNTQGASSAEIERGAGMHESEVSIAMRCLAHLGWVRSSGRLLPNRGRPVNKYQLVKPLTEIMEFIESGTRARVMQHLRFLNKMQFPLN
jgi:predicted transcriptional regulator